MKTLSEARKEALARRRQRRAELRKAPPDAKNQQAPFGRFFSEIPLSAAVEAAIQKEFDTLELWRRIGFPLPVDISVLYEERLKEISPQKFSTKGDRRTRGIHGVMLGDLLAEREVTMEFVSTIYDRYMDLVKTIIDKLDKSTLGLTEEACRNLAIATLAALANLLASRILYDGRKDSVDESKALQDLANAMDRLSDALSVVSSHPTLSPVFNDFVRNDIKKIIESSGIIIAIESDVSKVADLHRMLVDGSVSTIMLILLQAVQLTTQIILNPTKLASKIRDYPDYKFTFDVARAWQACVGRRPTASWSRITDKSSPIVYFAEYLQAIEPSIGTETIRAVISAFPDLQGFVIARCSVGFDRARVVVVLALLSASFHVKKKSAHAAEQERPDI